MHVFIVNKIKGYMNIFTGQNLLEFAEHYNTDEDSKNTYLILYSQKGLDAVNPIILDAKNVVITKESAIGVVIQNHLQQTPYCTRLNFGIRKAFFICFEMSTTTKSLSESHIGVHFGITEKAARLLMHKVHETIKSSGNHPIDGAVHIDEFVVADKEDGAVGRSYYTKKRRLYAP